MSALLTKNVLVFCSAPSWQAIAAAQRLAGGREARSYTLLLPKAGESDGIIQGMGLRTFIGGWNGMFDDFSLSPMQKSAIAEAGFDEIYILCGSQSTAGYEKITSFCGGLGAGRLGFVTPDFRFLPIFEKNGDRSLPKWVSGGSSLNGESCSDVFYTERAYPKKLTEDPLWEDFGGVFETTFLCNYECAHCPRKVAELDKGKSIEPEAFRHLASDGRIRHITLLGLGETLMNPSFGEIAEIIAEKEVAVAIVTNGSFLTQKRLGKLARPGLTLIVSVDGASEETYDLARHPGYLPRILENIRSIKQANPEIKVIINTVASADNFKDAPALVQLAHSIGACKVNLLNVLSLELDSDGRHGLVAEGHEREAAFMEARRLGMNLGVEFAGKPLLPSMRTCISPWNQMYVAMNGDVYPCSFIYRIPGEQFDEYFLGTRKSVPLAAFRLGNLFKDSLDNIWNGPTARRIRRKLLESQKEQRLQIEEYLKLREETSLEDPLDYCKICLNRWNCAC